jgi:spore germination protein GerM
MQDQHQQGIRRIPLSVAAAIAAALLAGGGGAAWFAWNSLMSSRTPPVTSTSPSPTPVQPAAEETIQVYWLNSTGKKIEVVPSSITLKDTDEPSEILEGAFKNLLTGPADPAFTTTIPQGTKLRKIALESDGIYVDLSKEFTTGGGSTSMMGRVAQVLYTASTLDPAAKVWTNP